MIIDADCHISSRKFDALAITATELIAQMDRADVDKALVWLKPPYDKEISPENRAIYDAYVGVSRPSAWLRLGQSTSGHRACHRHHRTVLRGVRLLRDQVQRRAG